MTAAALTGRTAVVTGANSGVGRAVTELLLAAGAAVTLVCRHRGRGEQAMADLGAAFPAAALEIADLASLGSVRELGGVCRNGWRGSTSW